MKRASCGLMYGAMNTLKTTNLGRIAKWLYEKYGLVSRLISADNEYDTLNDLIEAGAVEPLAILNIPAPFPKLTKLSQGMWPVIDVNGKLDMRPTPIVDGYMVNGKGQRIGAYLIEGTTTIGEVLRQNHIDEGRPLGGEPVGKWTEEGINFARANQSHYGQVQDFVTMDLIPTFSMLPVRWVWWTGHEYAGEDEATGQFRLGPGVVGKAATQVVPRKLGNTFHMALAESTNVDPVTKKKTMERRGYFEPHPSTIANVMWPAGVKIGVEYIQMWQERFPGGHIPLTLKQGVEQYLQFQDELAEKHKKLIITPGSMPVAGDVSGEVHQGATSIPAPPPAAASQVRPPARPMPPAPYRRLPVQPIRKPSIIGRPVISEPEKSLEAQLSKGAIVITASTPPEIIEEALSRSIEQATGQPLVLPDINAVSGSTEPEPDKEGA